VSEPIFTWTHARYAKGLEAVRVMTECGLFMDRARRLAHHFSRRWSNREGAYLMSPSAVSKMVQAYQRGADASPITGKLTEKT
jgi:hypothetical protein